jgi:hypothetical protein
VERLHKTMRAEFFTGVDGVFATVQTAAGPDQPSQAALLLLELRSK